MNCYACAEQARTETAVGMCRHCGAGLCREHLEQARAYRVGGMAAYACQHKFSLSTGPGAASSRN